MKILIIGSVATGKTCFSKKLSKKLNIRRYEIDSIVHDDINKIKRNEEAQKEIIDKINKEDSWILEGVLRKNLFYLLDFADCIIYLNIPVSIRKRRIIFRFVKQVLKLEKVNYKPTFNMIKLMYKWTNDFEENKKEFELKLECYKDKLVELNNKNKIKEYLKN